MAMMHTEHLGYGFKRIATQPITGVGWKQTELPEDQTKPFSMGVPCAHAWLHMWVVGA